VLAVVFIYVAIVGLCAGALVESGVAFARVSARHAAQHYAEIGLVQARAQLVSALAGQVAAGATSLSAPAPAPVAPACGVSPCAFISSATFVLTGTVGGTESPNVYAANLQTHPSISESRVAATIVETVSSSAGAQLAVRTQYVTMRIFRTPPFATIDGVSDAAASRDLPSEGDAGGALASAPAPVASMDPADTRIHALTECFDGGSGACGGQIYSSADPPGARAETPWFNANARSESWSR
jgi:hypothetical protein